MRECEDEGARVLQRGRNLAPLPSHSLDLEPRVFLKVYISDTFEVFM